MSTMELYGRTWEVVSDFPFNENEDWLVIQTDFGELWMNNLCGTMHFVTHTGTILKTYI